jgi:glucose/arabinose dehydrogenase
MRAVVFSAAIFLALGCSDDSDSSGGAGGAAGAGATGGVGGSSGSAGAAASAGAGASGGSAGCSSGTPCGSECVDTTSNPLHCGACNTPCSAGQACQSSSCADVPPAGQGDLVMDVIAKNLEVVWEIRFLSAAELLITERPGRVSRVAIASGEVSVLGTLPVLDSGEGGLMGLALSPDFATDSYAYVCYTYDDGGTKNRVSRVTVSASQISDEVHLLSDIPGASNHNGCRLEFGSDGKLYVTTGDAQVSSNPGSGFALGQGAR